MLNGILIVARSLLANPTFIRIGSTKQLYFETTTRAFEPLALPYKKSVTYTVFHWPEGARRF